MVFGAPPEFKTRADGQAGLKERYGVVFKGFDALDESGPITLKALMDGQVQAADVFTTTPQILTDHLVSLADPKSDFAAQNVVPLVYRKGVDATIVNTLDAISARLTTAGLLQMDKAIVVDHANYPAVAAAWLKAEGLPS
jgi:osmoprotectant transport system substrate-binding protein